MHYFLFALIFGFLNIVTSHNTYASLLLGIIEYIIVYYFIMKGKNFNALSFFLIFTSVSLEMDDYVFGTSVPIDRYSFFNFPSLYDWPFNITTVILFVSTCKMRISSYIQDLNVFLKWNKFLLISGTISIILAMIFNDNGIISSGLYPKLAISTILRYSFLILFFATIIEFCMDSLYKYELQELLKGTLLGVAISSVLGVLVGFHGYYGEHDNIILAPMIFGYTPCLLLFYRKDNPKTYKYLLASLLVIFVAFYHPSCIGSKWYLIIAGTIYAFVYSRLNIDSNWVILGLFAVILLLVPTMMQLLGSLMSQGDYNQWKFAQALGALDVFSHDSFKSWFESLDNSAQFRIDEIMNISIEYTNNPLFILFGKGLGGTTLHYTNYVNLNWEGDTSFTIEQIKNGFFYQMHESSGLLYLRHGIAGLAFLGYVIYRLISNLKSNPWAMIGLLWFFFYWGFCVSFRLGALALVLALMKDYENDIEYVED